jgi:hypothetical protein
MQEKIKSLILILSRMNVLYNRVLMLLDLEKQQLIRLDYENLYLSFREKDEILSAIRGLDKDRLKIQDQFSIVMGIRADELTLKKMSEALISQDPISAKDGEHLLRIRNELEETLAKIKSKINLNNQFIEKSVENLRGIAETVTSAMSGEKPSVKKAKSGIYTGRAKIEQKSPSRGKLVEKRL